MPWPNPPTRLGVNCHRCIQKGFANCNRQAVKKQNPSALCSNCDEAGCVLCESCYSDTIETHWARVRPGEVPPGVTPASGTVNKPIMKSHPQIMTLAPPVAAPHQQAPFVFGGLAGTPALTGYGQANTSGFSISTDGVVLNFAPPHPPQPMQETAEQRIRRLELELAILRENASLSAPHADKRPPAEHSGTLRGNRREFRLHKQFNALRSLAPPPASREPPPAAQHQPLPSVPRLPPLLPPTQPRHPSQQQGHGQSGQSQPQTKRELFPNLKRKQDDADLNSVLRERRAAALASIPARKSQYDTTRHQQAQGRGNEGSQRNENDSRDLSNEDPARDSEGYHPERAQLLRNLNTAQHFYPQTSGGSSIPPHHVDPQNFSGSSIPLHHIYPQTSGGSSIPNTPHRPADIPWQCGGAQGGMRGMEDRKAMEDRSDQSEKIKREADD